MSLESFFEDDQDDKIQELIKRRRQQMLVHSCIYYELNDNIIDDHTWQTWADELQELQTKHPHLCQIDDWDYYFKNWDGATGNHLPHRHPKVYYKSLQILEYARRIE